MEEFRKARENLFVMTFCSLLSLVILFYIIPNLIKVPAAAQKDAFTPRTFPYFCGGIMLLCSVIGLIKSVIVFVKERKAVGALDIHGEKRPSKTVREKIVPFVPWIVYGLVCLYGVGIDKIGFIIPTAVIIPTLLLFLGCKKWNWYLYVYCFAVAMWVIFKFALKVPLP